MIRGSIVALSMTFAFLLAASASAQQPMGPAPQCGIQTFRAPNPMGASATIWRGQPVIIVDPSQFTNQLWLDFVVAHECAHHVIGHTLPNGMWFRNSQYWATAAQELEADCWAARNVHPRIAQFAAQYFARTQGNMSGAPGYPTGYQRAHRILQCAGLQ